MSKGNLLSLECIVQRPEGGITETKSEVEVVENMSKLKLYRVEETDERNNEDDKMDVCLQSATEVTDCYSNRNIKLILSHYIR